MAEIKSYAELRRYELSNGETADLIDLIDAENMPRDWVAPASLTELKVGQVAYVNAMGRMRRGVVTKIARVNVTVSFTTKGAVDDGFRYDAGESIRVQSTATTISQVRVAPVAPVATEETPAETQDERASYEQLHAWTTRHNLPSGSDQDIQAAIDADHAEALTLHSQDCKVSPDSEDNEPEGDEMSTETTTEVQATDNTDAPARPIQTGDMTGSAVVTLMEEVWERIRQNHPELPAVIIVTGTGMIGPSRWGHFRANGWMARAEGENAATNLALGEMFMAGETLAKGARQVLQTMLHEGAHVLAKVREMKDTSRQGRWHNKTFLTLAQELGLEHKAATAHTQHGYSFVTLTAEAEAKYADLLDELDREIRLVVDLPWFLKGTEKPAGEEGEDESEGGHFIGGGRKTKTTATPQSGNLKATCTCPEPNIIRASRKVLDLRVVSCDDCDSIFTVK